MALYEAIPYTISVDDKLLRDTRTKLDLARYPDQQEKESNNWRQGVRVEELRAHVEHWRDQYDWEAEQAKLNNEFKHFKTRVQVEGYGELTLHFVHEVSDVKGAIPLLFSHGWPGSFLEVRKVIHELAHPENSSGSVQAFHVIAPSIPGFGFSDAPARSGVGPTIVARAFDAIMHQVLGYERYVVQGGDFGSFITRSMAIQFPQRVRAQHLNMFPVSPPTPWQPVAYFRYLFSNIFYSEWEKTALVVRRNFEIDQSGYLEQQKTRPQTLGVALGDSPTGLLAWFLEKFHDWVDHCNYSFTPDEVITFVMMHWIQGATPGLRFYTEAFYRSRDTDSTFEVYVPTPTGVSMYPKEQLHCPRDWATKVANVVFWKEHTEGGHFSSVECPRQFISDMREFFSLPAVKKNLEAL